MFADVVCGLVMRETLDLWGLLSEIASAHGNCFPEGSLYFIERFNDSVEIRAIGLHKGPFHLWGLRQSLLHCGKCQAVDGVSFKLTTTKKRGERAQSICQQCDAKSEKRAAPPQLAQVLDDSVSSGLMWHRFPINPEFLTFLSATMERKQVAQASSAIQTGAVRQVSNTRRGGETMQPASDFNCCIYCGFTEELLTCCRCRRKCCHTSSTKSVPSKFGCIDWQDANAAYPNRLAFTCPECLHQDKEVIPVSMLQNVLNTFLIPSVSSFSYYCNWSPPLFQRGSVEHSSSADAII